MRNVFIVEEIKFIYMALEETFSQVGIDTYVHNESGNFSYFLDDLKPDLMLVSLDMIKENIAGFKAELDKAELDVRVIAYGEASELSEHSSHFFATLPKPLEPSQLVAQLTQLMTQN